MFHYANDTLRSIKISLQIKAKQIKHYFRVSRLFQSLSFDLINNLASVKCIQINLEEIC